MPNPHAAINPKLISVITGQDLKTVKEKPTFAMLPGQYAGLVVSGKRQIKPHYRPNKHYLVCGHCGRKGQYDLGLILFNAARWFEKVQKGQKPEEQQEQDFMDYIQTTGYFRCKHCNGAGKWETKYPFMYFGVIAELLMGRQSDGGGYATGELRLFDGSSPRWVSDGEERFLDRLQEAGPNGYLWNRLGNLYNKGGRPDLAVVAFEQSIRVDPGQMESHYSLGCILFQLAEDKKAAYHFRMMLVYARAYKELDAIQMRDMLAAGLQHLFEIHIRSNRGIPFLPSREEWAALDGLKITANNPAVPELTFLDLELHPDQLESFWPLAEMYMGNLRMDLPAHERTLNKHLPGGGMTGTEVNKGYTNKKINGSMRGSKHLPVIIKVSSQEKGRKIARICDRFGLPYIMEFDFTEDLSDLEEALKERLAPDNPYSPCPCGSGQKYKFCCAIKMKNFDLNQFIADFAAEG